MYRLINIFIAIFFIITVRANAYSAEGVRQSTIGDQSPAINILPGGTLNLQYNNASSQQEIDKYTALIKQHYSECLEATIAFQREKLEELNGKLRVIYAQDIGGSAEEGRKWAQDVIENAHGLQIEKERIEESNKEYNKEFSKNVVAIVYKLFTYTFNKIDSRLIAMQELNPKIKYEKDERFILFADELTPSTKYAFRKLSLSAGHGIEIYLIPGTISKGIVSTCPTLEFAEVNEQNVMQHFSISPLYKRYGIMNMSGNPNGVQFKPTNIDMNINGRIDYLATGEDALTNEFKNQFDVTLQNFVKIAYAR